MFFFLVFLAGGGIEMKGADEGYQQAGGARSKPEEEEERVPPPHAPTVHQPSNRGTVKRRRWSTTRPAQMIH